MDRMTLFFYGAVLAGVLTVTTFIFSVMLVPAWNWVGTVPGAIKNATAGMFTSKSPTPQPFVGTNRQIAVVNTPAPVIIAPGKTTKPPDCGQTIKQLKAGHPVSLPAECEQTYRAFREQEQARLEARRGNSHLPRELPPFAASAQD